MDLQALEEKITKYKLAKIQLSKNNGFKGYQLTQYAQELIADIGYLGKAIMAKNGYRNLANTDAIIRLNLVGCFINTLIIVQELKMDLAKDFASTMAEIYQRITGISATKDIKTFNDLVSRSLQIKTEYRQYNKKNNSNKWGLAEYYQGLVGDAAFIIKLLLSYEDYESITNWDRRLRHEVCECLWSIIILADELEIDIEKEIIQKVNMEVK